MLWPIVINLFRKQCYHTAGKYKQSVTHLAKLPSNEVCKWIDSFDTVLTDCDGVLWDDYEIIDGAATVIKRLQDIGKQVIFATNNSTKTQLELAEKATCLGFNINKCDVLIPTKTAAMYLKSRNFNKKVYVIGCPALGEELDNVGIQHIGIGTDSMTHTYRDLRSNGYPLDPNVGAVIVGFDEQISYPKLVKAATYLNKPECLFIATNTDERGVHPHVVLPCAGSMVRAMEAAADRTALILGKPNPIFCADLVKERQIQPDRTLMIGDRGNTDMMFGFNCNFQTLLVGSGIHSLQDVDRWKMSNNAEDMKQIPDVYLPKLGDLLPFIKIK